VSNKIIKKTRPIKLPLELSNNKIEMFNLYYFEFEKGRYIVLTKGDISGKDDVLLRIESACIFGHIFGSVKCDCSFQLKESMKLISESGKGILIYAVDEDALGLGTEKHFKIYELRQHEKMDIKEIYEKVGVKDKRDYSPIIEILSDFNIKSVKLLTNNKKRVKFLRDGGIEVKRIPLKAELSEYNKGYLTKKYSKELI